MNNIVLVTVLILGLMVGTSGGNFISKLNPFSGSRTHVEKSETQREEYFRDKVKGIEYRVEERTKNRTPSSSSASIGSKVGSFIDSSLNFIIGFFIVGVILFLFFGVNIFRYVKRIGKTLKQVIIGIQKSKEKMNGEKEILRQSLSSELDADSKKVISDIKHKGGLK